MLQVCRTCLQEIADLNFICLRDATPLTESLKVKDVLSIFVPELALDITADPVMCASCMTSLHQAYDFKQKCLRTEERIRSYVHSLVLGAKDVSIIALVSQENDDKSNGSEAPEVDVTLTKLKMENPNWPETSQEICIKEEHRLPDDDAMSEPDAESKPAAAEEPEEAATEEFICSNPADPWKEEVSGKNPGPEPHDTDSGLSSSNADSNLNSSSGELVEGQWLRMDRTRKISIMAKNSEMLESLNRPRYETRSTQPQERAIAMQWFQSRTTENDAQPTLPFNHDQDCTNASQTVCEDARFSTAVDFVQVFPSTSKMAANYSMTSTPNEDCTATSSCSKRHLPKRKCTMRSVKGVLFSEKEADNFSDALVNRTPLLEVQSTVTDSDNEPFQESEEEYIPSPPGSNEPLLEVQSTVTDSDNDPYQESEEEYIPSTPGSNESDDCQSVFALNSEKNLRPDETESNKHKEQVKNKVVVSKIAQKKINNVGAFDRNTSKDAAVTFQHTEKDDGGKIIRNKSHCCYICDEMFSNNMARHFETAHGANTEVARILAFPKGSAFRREGFQRLIRTGDFYHNCNVLATRTGELILVRRPTEFAKFSYSDFGPCPQCLGFMLKRLLWHHIKYGCKLKSGSTSDVPKKGPMNESAALLYQIIGKQNSNDFVQKIVATFRSDEISVVCKEDTLIMEFGAFMFEKYGGSQVECIRQSMRELARLKIQICELESSVKGLEDAIAPGKFNLIVAATKRLCRVNCNNTDTRNELETPSLALKIGYHLRKCIAIERGVALRNGNTKRDGALVSLLTLMDIEWSVRISPCALYTMYQKTLNAKQLLPVTSDLLQLNLFLEKEMEKLKSDILHHCTRELWSNLASLTLCRIILFNKRRCGETSQMTLEHYSSRPSWADQATDDLKSSLTTLEKQLANRLTVVEIIGKRGRKVPVLLTSDVKTCIDLLIKYRREGEIADLNPYVFACSRVSLLECLRGHDCLRKSCLDAGVPSENITGTKLRKYIATVCQIFDLEEHEQEWLARHLGHDFRIHRDFCRKHESAVEVTKISRILMAVDQGEAGNFAGKQLSEISIEVLKINKKKKVPRTKCFKQTWTDEQKGIVLRIFKTNIKLKMLPGKADCEKCIEENKEIFSNRKWTDIKFFIKNHLTKIKDLRKK